MQQSILGPFGPVSRLTLGGGGIGMVWGQASEDDAIGTLHRAVEAGINLIDTAPGYKTCEAMIAKAFEGRVPQGVRITTKYSLGTPPAGEVYSRLRTSLEASLAAMRISQADMMLLHTEIRPDDFVYADESWPRDKRSTSLSLYRETVAPAFEQLVREGLIASWGITGFNHTGATIDAISSGPRPAALQAITNLMGSAGEMNGTGTPGRPRDIIAAAKANGVGVMGVRAVQAGALTSGLDRKISDDQRATGNDFDRAARYRALCRQWGQDPAIIAHRYALGMAGVDTLVLGVKTVAELEQALAAERDGALDAEQVAAIDALGLRA
jgi:aryl-alcohol dehydrogenase-like predicted oxidoreductase